MNSESTTMTKEEIRMMLKTNSKGAVMQSLGNCMLVFQNDPLLKGSIRRNSLTERIDIEKDLGWCRSDTAVTDTDINYLRLYFEENYSITAEKNIQCALDIVANEAHYHPICDVLLGLQWDGEERICNALTKFLGVPIDKLRPFENHPFWVKDDAEMDQLVFSVLTQGLLTPIVVRETDTEEYEVISGHRRLRACQKAGIETGPALI